MDMKKSTSVKPEDNLRIVEEKIHPEIFSEFFNILEKGEEESQGASKDKMGLIKLAKEGSVGSYRAIEKILKEGKLTDELRDFALVALHYCRFKVENELLDIETDMISGGLGGAGNRLRVYVALAGKDNKDITQEQFLYIKDTFRKVAEERDSVLEEAAHHGFYISLLLLLSVDCALADILDRGIGHCDFLQSDYYATNVEIPDDSRIRYWLDSNLDDDEFSIKT